MRALLTRKTSLAVHSESTGVRSDGSLREMNPEEMIQVPFVFDGTTMCAICLLVATAGMKETSPSANKFF